MNDRELLGLAAKAAGYVVSPLARKADPDWDGLHVQIDGWSPTRWNPLTSDGDALRLAVKLNIVIWECDQYNCSLVEIRYGKASGELTEPIVNNDPYAATRRAVVRAAAEIGKAMEG